MSNSPPPLVQDDLKIPGPHLPWTDPYWDTHWDSLHWPRPVEKREWAEGKGQHRGNKENTAKKTKCDTEPEPEATTEN